MASDSPAPPSSATSNSKVNHDTIERAVNALIKWKNSQSKSQKPQLLPQDDFLYLTLTLKKIPPKGTARTTPHKLPLPHPLFSPFSSELCLIIDDRPKSKLTSESAKKKIKAEEIPVTKVIKLSKLKSDYKAFEAKRKLCDSYDLFFADKRVVQLLPKLLGKQFFKKKKLPLPVDLTKSNWKEQINRACSSALLYVKTGTCSVVRVGKVSMEIGELVENVAAAIDGAVELVVPKNWTGVRSLHLKFSESLALPIYQALPDMKLKIQGIKDIVEGSGELGVKEESKKYDKLGKKKGSKKKGRIHEVRYMDASVGDDELASDSDGDDNESGKNENDDLGSAKSVGKKRNNGDSKKERVLSELNGEKMGKKIGKVKGGSDDGKDDDESNKSENDDMGSAKSVGKKRKKGDSKKERFLTELNGEKMGKKIGKVEKGGSDDGEDDDKSNKSENDDLGSAGFGSKKKKKGDSIKGEVLSKKSGEKRAKKTSKKGDGEEEKKGGLALAGIEESGGKRGKKKSDLGKALKNAAADMKIKKSKKKQSAE